MVKKHTLLKLRLGIHWLLLLLFFFLFFLLIIVTALIFLFFIVTTIFLFFGALVAALVLLLVVVRWGFGVHFLHEGERGHDVREEVGYAHLVDVNGAVVRGDVV